VANVPILANEPNCMTNESVAKSVLRRLFLPLRCDGAVTCSASQDDLTVKRAVPRLTEQRSQLGHVSRNRNNVVGEWGAFQYRSKKVRLVSDHYGTCARKPWRMINVPQ